MGYVGQAHRHVHVCACASAEVPGEGDWGLGDGWARGRHAVPVSPCQGLGTQGLRQEPQPICVHVLPLAEPLCYRILAFEGKSEHLAPSGRLVPWGSPRGSLCP